jgi:tetratricopeptide (TPR) repeat protein
MDTIEKSQIKQQHLIFGISLVIFCLAAVIGWVKLRYGFNFIDEGYHMTEAWRLTAGDDFFRDKFTGALRCSTFINYLVFKAYPAITLLGFRELQYVLTMLSLVLLAYALFMASRQYWYQPLIFSVFAFVGLDPVGMISNIYYQTYPHLFIIFHLAFFIMGLHQRSQLVKSAFYVISGLWLWLISFSLLHMSLAALSPIAVFLIFKAQKIKSPDFSFTDLCLVLAPVIMFWAVFIGTFNKPFIDNVFASIQLILSTPTHAAGTLVSINWEAMKHVAVTIPFFIAVFFIMKIKRITFFGIALIALALLEYLVIDTAFFGMINPYYNGWFDRPMWFVALLMSSYALSCCYFVWKILKRQQWKRIELYAMVLIIPSIIMALSSSTFSNLGILTVLHSSIPAVAAITVLFLSLKTVEQRSYLEKFMILLLFLAPFYYTTAWSDWRFTFFDVTPEQASVEIDKGFGRGIRTNQVYKDLYDWIGKTSEKYSKKDDYIISYVVSPMVHMISRRRPALDDPFVNFIEVPADYYVKAIDFMKQGRREPRLAFVFEGMPGLLPISLKEGTFKWIDRQFSLPSSDPISDYVVKNMVLLDTFQMADGLSVKCFIDKTFALEESLKSDPANPEINMRLGAVYQKRGDFDNAVRCYKKALQANPGFIPGLQSLAVVYSLTGDNPAALETLKRIIAIDPDRNDTYYNIACIYAKQKQIDDSIAWLRKAVEKGFKDWNLLRTDRDVENIRGTEYYKEIMNRNAAE